MIKGFFFILLMMVSSFSIAEGEDNHYEEDEIQNVIRENEYQTNDLASELKEIGYNKLGLDALKDPRVKDLIAKQFDDSNISLMSLENKRKIFNDQFKNSTLKEVLDNFPKVKDIVIDVITDKNSIIGLISIVQKHERIYVIYILVSALIINLILKKIFASSSNFLLRFFQRLLVNAFTFLLVLTTLFFLYKKELSPIVKIVASHFKS